jgi:hypothetical protein
VVLGIIYGHEGEEVKGRYRKLHNEELCNFCYLPNNIMMIKIRRMR